MRRLVLLPLLLILGVVLSACVQGARFEIDGTYDYTVTITESDDPGRTVGETWDGTLVIATNGDVVDVQLDSFTGTGTRSGNTLSANVVTGVDDIDLTLTWTSDDAFSGGGRDDLDGGTYFLFDMTGTTAVMVVGQDAQDAPGNAWVR